MKPNKNLLVGLFIVCCAVLLGLFIETNVVEEQITVTTDKAEYGYGEPLKITIQNKQEGQVDIYGPSVCANFGFPTQVEKYDNGAWVKVFQDCPPFDQISDKLNLGVENDDYTSLSVPSNSFFELRTVAYEVQGSFRIVYYLGRGKLAVYSNEFTIKEK